MHYTQLKGDYCRAKIIVNILTIQPVELPFHLMLTYQNNALSVLLEGNILLLPPQTFFNFTSFRVICDLINETNRLATLTVIQTAKCPINKV